MYVCMCVLQNVEEDHVNDTLGNPGLISPDKEDLSRLLVCEAEKMPGGLFLMGTKNE